MIKATLSDGSVILGLSAENIKRLKEGKPIQFDGRIVGFPGDVAIIYGETEEIIMRDLANAQAQAKR